MKEISYKTQKSLDTLAGEIGKTIEEGKDLNVFMSRNLKGRPLNEFVLLFADSLFMAIDDEQYKIGLREIKVILRIIHYAQYGNLISFPRKKIMEETKLSSVSLSKALRKLTDSGILMSVDDGLYLNPQVIAKGRLHDYESNEELENITEIGARVLAKTLKSEPNIKTKKMRKKDREINMTNKFQGRLDGLDGLDD